MPPQPLLAHTSGKPSLQAHTFESSVSGSSSQPLPSGRSTPGKPPCAAPPPPVVLEPACELPPLALPPGSVMPLPPEAAPPPEAVPPVGLPAPPAPDPPGSLPDELSPQPSAPSSRTSGPAEVKRIMTHPLGARGRRVRDEIDRHLVSVRPGGPAAGVVGEKQEHTR